MCFSIFMGLLPLETISRQIALAEEQHAVEKAVTVEGFSELLDQLDQGEERSSGIWRYVLFMDLQYAVIIGHDDPSAAEVEVPDMLGNADVVGIANDVFYGHGQLTTVQVPGNVFVMGPRAIPRGVAVRAVNASYAQSWARKNSRAFVNASEYDFQTGVIDLTGTRAENFVRVSATEVWLRELEAKRLKVGKLFFLLDPANPYQISFYKVSAISEPSDRFVSVSCVTPEVEDILFSFSMEDQLLMPDFSTLQLEESTSLDNISRQKGSSSCTLPLKVNLKELELSDHWKLSCDMTLQAEYKASYDFSLFQQKKLSLTETDSFSVTGKITWKGDNRMMSKDDQIANALNTGIYQDFLSDYLLTPNQANPLKYNHKLCSIMVFSIGGIVNVLPLPSKTGHILRSNGCPWFPRRIARKPATR